MSLLTPLALSGLLGTAGAALAQQSPYYVGGSLGVTHVSNVYHTGDQAPRNDDNVTTATLLAGIDQHFGRQRLFGDLALRSNHYQKSSGLDNLGYTLSSGLDWQAADRFSGQLGYTASRNLAEFNPDSSAPDIRKKNIEQMQQFSATVRYGLVSLLSLEAGLMHRNRDYSASEYDRFDYQQDTLSLGLSYRPSPQLTLGVATRFSEGEYPHYRRLDNAYQADEFERRDLDLTANWLPSEQSALYARISMSRREHSGATDREFSGLTGSLRWRYKPTAKLVLNTTLIRDTGDEASFYNLGTPGASTSDYSNVSNSLYMTASYELTGKITLDANLGLTRRKLSNDLADMPLSGSDRHTSLGLGGRWAFSRNGLFGCQITRDERDGDPRLSRSYSAFSYGCYVQLVLR